MKLSLAPVCMAIFMIGCAGSTTNAWNNSTDAGPSFTAPDDTLDGGLCDGGPNVWRHTPDSWILKAPKIHLVFWGDWWVTSDVGSSNLLEDVQVWNVLANDPVFYSPVREYGVGAGQFNGTYITYPDLPLGLISDEAIQSELIKEMNNNSLPAGDEQSLFIIMLPPNTQSEYDVSNDFSGHHGYLNHFTYATIENHSDTNIVISHEIYEAVTDPDAQNGWWGPGGETEIGDLCTDSNSWFLDGYSITKVWSQAHCQCAPNN